MTSKLFMCLSACVLSASTWAAAPANYYSSVDDASASVLRSSLHSVIDDHTRFPYTSSSTDTWDILEDADEDADNPSHVTTIYKNASYAKQGGGNSSYNREHSWPKSYGFPNDGSSNYAYTDAHHLFIADSQYNSTRGNEYFDTCSSGCNEKVSVFNDGQGGGGDSNWTDTDSWEVWSKRKGDIARAMFYMDVRYEGGSHGITGYSEPNLILTNNAGLINTTGSNASVAYMGLLDTLLQWHIEDPVSADELARNDVVFGYQGNRNPFVDHPEWVECVFNSNCSGTVDFNGEQHTNINGNAGQWRNYSFDVPNSATSLDVMISGGTGDADLYIRHGALPTQTTYDCRPYLAGNNESCVVNSPQAGTWRISIYGYEAYSGVMLKYETN